MLSALKKLAKGGDERCQAPVPMSSSLQKKFSKGVHYNMKILIKGDRNVGKSCLLQRLQGGPFIEQYAPTDQIQVAPIHWTYKNSDYIVKVEVWEVVDKGRTRKKPPLGLKLDNQSAPVDSNDSDTPVLDASFLDVHKNANGVILMMDITKPWTFEYVVKELSRVPPHLPVVVLGNHCDMMHHRQVHAHHIDAALQDARAHRSAPVRYAESSMRNGFGLRLLHKFLSVPFLRLQRATLLQQLQRNQQDVDLAETELDEFQSSEESDYTLFTERLASKRRENTPGQGDVPAGRSIVLGGGKPIVPAHVNPLLAQSLKPQVRTPERERESDQLDKDRQQSSYVSPQLLKAKPAVSLDVTPTSGAESVPATPSTSGGGVLDEFYAGNLDSSFLDDLAPLPQAHDADSDSDDGNATNPMVMTYEDDLDDNHYENTAKNNELQFFKTGIVEGKNSNADYKSYSSERKSSASFTLEHKHSTLERQSSTSERKNSTSGRKSSSSSTSEHKHSTSEYRSPTDFKPSTEVTSSISEQRSLVDRFMQSSIRSEGLGLLAHDVGMDDFDLWTRDSSARRSPEGGEDPDPEKESEKTEKRHKKKKSKDKDREKQKERGDGDKERKERKHKQKRSKEKDKKSPQQDLFSPGFTVIDAPDYDSI